MGTQIQWTDATWNPVRGCSAISEGCRNCYAMHVAARFSGPGQPYEGLAKRSPARWVGHARVVPERLADPLRWRKPRRVFVNSMSDLFHASLTNDEIADVWAVMLITSLHETRGGHTYQVLTKRPERMRDLLMWEDFRELVARRAAAMMEDADGWHDLIYYQHWKKWGPAHPRIWLGVSIEDQDTADERVPLLLQCPAAVRFVSAEPLLGPVDLSPYLVDDLARMGRCPRRLELDWVIVGGESGPGARPCAVEWIRGVVEQCRDAQVPVFVKQLGGNVFAPWLLQWDERLDGSLDLFGGPTGHNFATVWRNGTWHTWDQLGTGGENDTERSVEAAKSAAMEALSRQHLRPQKGWNRHRHMLVDKKGGAIEEWPEDLRVRQWPDARGFECGLIVDLEAAETARFECPPTPSVAPTPQNERGNRT